MKEKLKRMSALKPAFISVTCGAGGTGNAANDGVCRDVLALSQTECVAHLTCVGLTREKARERLAFLAAEGVRKILALRGDFPAGESNVPGELPYAKHLVELIREENRWSGFGFEVYVAGYPEGHRQNPDGEDDFRRQMEKARMGTAGIVSQMCFDESRFLDYFEKVERTGYRGRIIAGVFPVTDAKGLVKIAKLCEAFLPLKLRRACEKYGDDPVAMKAWGLDYAVRQIENLKANGVSDFHLYVMNRIDVARRLASCFDASVSASRRCSN